MTCNHILIKNDYVSHAGLINGVLIDVYRNMGLHVVKDIDEAIAANEEAANAARGGRAENHVMITHERHPRSGDPESPKAVYIGSSEEEAVEMTDGQISERTRLQTRQRCEKLRKFTIKGGNRSPTGSPPG